MAHHVAGRRAVRARPARAGLADRARVEAAAVDDHVGVAGDGVDRHVRGRARASRSSSGRSSRAACGAARRSGARRRSSPSSRSRCRGRCRARRRTCTAPSRSGWPPQIRRRSARRHRLRLSRPPRALQNRPGAEAHRGASLRADDAVGREAVPPLPALDRGLRGGAEDAVGGHAHLPLERPDAAAAARVPCARPARLAAPARAVMPALQDRPGAEPHRRARLRPGDAVGHEPVAALPALERALGGRPEDAVRRHADLALERRGRRRACSRRSP